MRRLVLPLLVITLLAARPAIVGEATTAADQEPNAPDGGSATAPIRSAVGALDLRDHPGDEARPALDAGRLLRPGVERAPPEPRALVALTAEIDALVDAPRWRRARIGVLAVDGETGDTLYARNAHATMAPASNMKVMTTAAALHLLGPDFRWMTWVTTEAPIVDGVVQGDVILYGTGDPMLEPGGRSPGPLDELARGLLERGIHRIEGRILGDGTYFVGPDRLDAWDPRDLDDWFAAASPALSYNANVVQMRVEPSVPGHAPLVHTDPDQGGVAIDNQALTVEGRPGGRLHMLRDAPTEPIRVVGDIARGGRDVYRSMTVQDPVLFAAHGFHAALVAAGVEVSGEPAVIRERDRSPLSAARIFTGGDHRVLARHRSPPLADALTVVNKESHNLYADLVLRTLGRVVAGEGSYAAGGRVVERFAVEEVGVPADAVRILDGSGLAADNRLTPAALVAVLRHALASPYGAVLNETLPEAGTRDLRRMVRTPAARNLRAKTGTIEGVSALTGIVATADGRPVVFSIIGNDLASAWGAKRLEDDIGAALAGWVSSGGS